MNKKKDFVTPKQITSDGVKELRTRLGMTQREFADFLRVSKPTIERWESQGKDISGPVAVLSQIAMLHPEMVEELALPEKRFPLRLVYRYKETVCTVIDVDEMGREVKIRNYARNLLYRAFGAVENPTYEEYEEFLESRCFPRTRDKMKIMLQQLDIPFYDPILIIQKTQGRMAEDDFWIEIVR
jgi:putative transcriptional regulator